MTKTNSERIAAGAVASVIDEIVDDLSQSGSGWRRGRFENQAQHGRCCRIGLSSPERSDQNAITSWSEYLVDRKGA